MDSTPPPRARSSEPSAVVAAAAAAVYRRLNMYTTYTVIRAFPQYEIIIIPLEFNPRPRASRIPVSRHTHALSPLFLPILSISLSLSLSPNVSLVLCVGVLQSFPFSLYLSLSFRIPQSIALSLFFFFRRSLRLSISSFVPGPVYRRMRNKITLHRNGVPEQNVFITRPGKIVPFIARGRVMNN